METVPGLTTTDAPPLSAHNEEHNNVGEKQSLSSRVRLLADSGLVSPPQNPRAVVGTTKHGVIESKDVTFKKGQALSEMNVTDGDAAADAKAPMLAAKKNTLADVSS